MSDEKKTEGIEAASPEGVCSDWFRGSTPVVGFDEERPCEISGDGGERGGGGRISAIATRAWRSTRRAYLSTGGRSFEADMRLQEECSVAYCFGKMW